MALEQRHDGLKQAGHDMTYTKSHGLSSGYILFVEKWIYREIRGGEVLTDAIASVKN